MEKIFNSERSKIQVAEHELCSFVSEISSCKWSWPPSRRGNIGDGCIESFGVGVGGKVG